MWTNGFIYPIDSLTNAPPPFINITTFLTFVGDGANGLLGYYKRLSFVASKESRARVHFHGLCNEMLQQHKKDIDRPEERMKLLQTHDETLKTVVLYTNRAPLVLAFLVVLLKHTMPEQPLSGRLSLAQAYVSLTSKSRAIYLGIDTGTTAEEEGFGEGQPSVTVAGILGWLSDTITEYVIS